MTHTRAIALSLALMVGACQPAAETPEPSDDLSPVEATTPLAADKLNIEADMRFLASDDLNGREAGTPGYDTAAVYVADRMQELGVTPAGQDGSFFQTVPLRRSYRVPEALSLSVTHSETGETLALEDNVDFVMFGSTGSANATVAAEAVFVGFGVVAPDLGRDDYDGLEIDGKIVIMLGGTPKGIQTEERAY